MRMSAGFLTGLGVLTAFCSIVSAQSIRDTACKQTPIAAGHLFVAARAASGDTLTNLQLEDPNSRSTVIRVRVAPGAQPLTVLLQSSGSLIWDFEGATDRVHRVMAAREIRDQHVAVRGLSAERVEFPELARCPPQMSPPLKANDANLGDNLAFYFGRAPDRVVFGDVSSSLVLPEATFAPARGADLANNRDQRSATERELFRFYAGGFREIDPNSLVSPVTVLSPETFPGEAGLVQLEKAGSIRPPLGDETEAFIIGASQPYRSKLSPNFRVEIGFNYVVTSDIMLPAGLHGGHLKSFLVLADVPAPRGNAGHSCVAFMNGFRTNGGPTCLHDIRDSIEYLRKLPPPGGTEKCRLMDLPADATLHAVSVHEPAGASGQIPAPINVRVNKPGAVALVLNTYQPAIWRLSLGAQTRIAGVVLTGYYPSSVEGIEPGVPILNLDLQSRASRQAPSDTCKPFHGYLSSLYRGGPAAMVLDRQIQALTGRQLDSLRGDYKLSKVEIR